MEIVAEVYTSLFYWKKIHQNYSKILYFVEHEIQNNKIKPKVYQNQNLWFSIT